MTTMVCARCSPEGNMTFVEDIILHLFKVHGIHALRFEYALDDLQRIARRAASTTRGMAGDFHDRYQAAFSAAAEALYQAEHWVPEHALFNAALRALLDEQTYGMRSRGWTPEHGTGSAPRFAIHWEYVCRNTPSPERATVERLAVEQILPILTPRQRQVVDALAVFGDHDAAAESVGVTKGCYQTTLNNARRRFLALWHEGETPSLPWGIDRRGGDARQLLYNRRARRHVNRGQVRKKDKPPKTHCKYNHEFTPQNTAVRPEGGRDCRQCAADRARRRRGARAGGQP